MDEKFSVPLAIHDRLTIMQHLPRLGASDMLRIVDGILKRVSIEDKPELCERTGYSKDENGIPGWGPTGEVAEDFEFSKDEVGVIGDAVRKASSDGKLHISQLALYGKFCDHSYAPRTLETRVKDLEDAVRVLKAKVS